MKACLKRSLKAEDDGGFAAIEMKMAVNPNTQRNIANGYYPPTMALKFLTEKFNISDRTLTKECQLSRSTLTRIRKGELITRSYDHYMRQFMKVLLQKLEYAGITSNDKLHAEILHLFSQMFIAHFALLNDEDLQREIWMEKFVAL